MFLTSSQQELLKYFAILFMVIDHIGFMFYPEHIEFRYIGRLAYPTFAFLIIYNYIYNTSNKEKYLYRIFFFALISEPFHYYFVKEIFLTNLYFANILFTLLIGLLIVHFFELKKYILLTITIVLTIIIEQYLSYHIFGILLILSFYIGFKYNFILGIFLQSIALLFLVGVNGVMIFGFYCLLFLPFLFIVSKIKLPKIKKVKGIYFYIFYPLHMLILKLIKVVN